MDFKYKLSQKEEWYFWDGSCYEMETEKNEIKSFLYID